MNDTNKTTILVVDDDVDYIAQQEVQLTAAGFRVISAENSTEALELLKTEKADLAIVDLMMRYVDEGFMLCHKLKKQYPAIRIILVTGVAGETGLVFDAATEEERSWVKADMMLTKPVRFEQLKREIDRLLAE